MCESRNDHGFVVRGLNRFKFRSANLSPVFLSDARPNDGDVATRVNERLDSFPYDEQLRRSRHRGGQLGNFCIRLSHFFLALRQLGPLPQTIFWIKHFAL